MGLLTQLFDSPPLCVENKKIFTQMSTTMTTTTPPPKHHRHTFVGEYLHRCPPQQQQHHHLQNTTVTHSWGCQNWGWTHVVPLLPRHMFCNKHPCIQWRFLLEHYSCIFIATKNHLRVAIFNRSHQLNSDSTNKSLQNMGQKDGSRGGRVLASQRVDLWGSHFRCYQLNSLREKTTTQQRVSIKVITEGHRGNNFRISNFPFLLSFEFPFPSNFPFLRYGIK